MKRVLISGGSRGIGRAIVEAFAANGDNVAFLYRSRDEEAAQVAAATGAVAIKADVSDPMEARRAITEAEAALGGSIDVLVNNAAISWIGQMQDMTDIEWRNILDTNLSGAFYLSRGVVSGMVRNHYGRIVSIGSMWGKVGAKVRAEAGRGRGRAYMPWRYCRVRGRGKRHLAWHQLLRHHRGPLRHGHGTLHRVCQRRVRDSGRC